MRKPSLRPRVCARAKGGEGGRTRVRCVEGGLEALSFVALASNLRARVEIFPATTLPRRRCSVPPLATTGRSTPRGAFASGVASCQRLLLLHPAAPRQRRRRQGTCPQRSKPAGAVRLVNRGKQRRIARAESVGSCRETRLVSSQHGTPRRARRGIL